MSIIIKGAEMPENCHECPCLRHDSWDGLHRYQCNNTLVAYGECDSWSYERRPNWCPLVELPEKHGRLIDGDALHALYESRWHDLQVLNWDENPHAEDIQTGVNWCINTLHDDLPTIVEAEGDIGVKPVVRGQWIWRHRHRGGFRRVTGEDDFGVRHTITVDERYQIDDPYCPFCGKLNESVFLNYCPNCGADMRDDKP